MTNTTGQTKLAAKNAKKNEKNISPKNKPLNSLFSRKTNSKSK